MTSCTALVPCHEGVRKEGCEPKKKKLVAFVHPSMLCFQCSSRFCYANACMFSSPAASKTKKTGVHALAPSAPPCTPLHSLAPPRHPSAPFLAPPPGCREEKLDNPNQKNFDLHFFVVLPRQRSVACRNNSEYGSHPARSVHCWSLSCIVLQVAG